MKKLLILTAILTTVSLSGACSEVEPIEDKIFYTATTRGSSNSLMLAYALGYHYTDNTKISIGPIVSFSGLAEREMRMGILTGLRYRHDIKDTSVAPYVNANLGVLSADLTNYNFTYRISSGADFLLSAKNKFLCWLLPRKRSIEAWLSSWTRNRSKFLLLNSDYGLLKGIR